MLPSIRALNPAVECASPCPLAAGVSAAVIALSDDMGLGLGCLLHCTKQDRSAILLPRMHRLGRIQASAMHIEHGSRAIPTSNQATKSNSYLSSDFDHPSRWDLEIVRS